MVHAHDTTPDQYNMSPNKGRIAIIGDGISGLACALRLTTSKYQVTIFEQSERMGGHLNNFGNSGELLADIDLQFRHEHYSLHLNTRVARPGRLEAYAVYIATRRDGDTFGLTPGLESLFATSRSGVFMDGSLKGVGTMETIDHDLNAASAVETWLKTGAMNYPYAPLTTKLSSEAIRIIPSGAVVPALGDDYSKEEAVAESKRCLKCCCDACVHYSPL
jgi:hypothetical protein